MCSQPERCFHIETHDLCPLATPHSNYWETVKPSRNGIPFVLFPEMDSYSGMTAADLNPDALARLEAKLMADLDMVRKVRALLTEHQMTPAVPLAAPASIPVTPLVPVAEVLPQVPARPREEVLMEGLAATAGRPFAPQDFKVKVKELTKQWPGDKEVKTFLTRLIRRGNVVVHEERKGRPGHLYRSLLPAVESAASADREP